MKMEVLERDGWDCLACGVTTRRWPDGKTRSDTLAFDHIVPEEMQGMTVTDNLQVLCTSCNSAKRGVKDYRPKAEVIAVPVYDADAVAEAMAERRRQRWGATVVLNAATLRGAS
jgi:hypothetical protein